ncbi:profilin-1-like [Paralichthys olivaceus]|uniref:profilin-1-like n=1 Tax=Paralichthys olivaceus TaxID=8255 RepID=UPI00374FE0B9
MSWQQYIDNLCLPVNGELIVQDAVICGIECKTVWASTPNYSSFPEEDIKVLSGDRSKFSSCGPKVNGEKCMLLSDRMDDESVYSLNLKTASDANGEKYNICVGKTLRALIIIKSVSGDHGGKLSKKMFATVDHLRKQSM